MTRNPFIISGYISPRYFCDRMQETEKILRALGNGRNLTLFSPHRYGKTGLIRHVFHEAKELDVITVYVDVFGTNDLSEFIEVFGQAIVGSIETNQQSFITKIGEMFKSLRPKVSFDTLTGNPELQLDFQTGQDKKKSLGEIFEFISKQKKKLFIAIDEFQQINAYEDKNTDGLLRSFIQQQNKATFLFSGSQKHLLLPMFNNPNRPFYQSTEFLHLTKLEESAYAGFITQMFEQHGKSITNEAVDFMLRFSDRHTYYSQFLCNRTFDLVEKTAEIAAVKKVITSIFEEREPLFRNYEKLLPNQQHKLLKAIAMEGTVFQPTSTAFIKKNHLNSAATVRKCLHSLLDKELVFETQDKEGNTGYRLYDVFLAQWIRWENEKKPV